MSSIVVRGHATDVREALAAGLSAEQLAGVQIAEEDDFGPQARGEQALYETIVTFVALSVAGGASYDLAKLALKLLIDRFGKDRVTPK